MGSGYSQQKAAEELGISRQTVKRYLSPDFNPANGNYENTRESKIKPYVSKIMEMINSGYTFKQIEESIRMKGYNGASSTIRMYATRERRRLKGLMEEEIKNTEKIERKWLVDLLYRPVDKVKGIEEEQVNRIIEKFPLIGRIYDIVQTFRETLFGKKPEDLENWMEEAKLLECAEINSFIGGLERDLDAVKNAITYEYNNGLAEGSVNKLKVIKRIMYGRNSFDLLRSKVLRLDLKRKIN